MRRVVWGEGGLGLDEVEPPPLADGFVRLRVEACGICGSDLHFWTKQFEPMVGTVPGHEFVGTVLDGPGGLPDRRYSASPIVACGRCEHCAAREWNLCRRGGDLIGLGRDGGLAEWVDVPVGNLVPLDGDVAPEIGALTEPIAVAVRGLGFARIRPGESVLVLGAGTIGLLAAALAREVTDAVVISARHPHQAAAAEALGLDVVNEADTMAWGKQHKPGVVIETVGGNAGTLDTAVRVAKRGGRVVILGSFVNGVPVDLFAAGQKEVAIYPSFGYAMSDGLADLDVAAAAVGRLQGQLGVVVTHRFPLEAASAAFAAAADKSSGAIKVLVTP